ncbi:MAG: Gfo/Idh/MocA family oxidoreductase [Alphaproteobacteria bacterium]
MPDRAEAPGSLLQRFGRRLRIGMVGGGSDSIIGSTHRHALRADGLYDLVAGCLSVDPAIARASAAAELLPVERSYTDWREMARAEAARDDGVDVVTVCTPPDIHADGAAAFRAAGLDVICEKPMTATLAQAVALQHAVADSWRAFLLTHCYTGYPMVRQARAMVRDGAIGAVRLVESDFVNGAFLTEEADPARKHWRFRPQVMGKASMLGEIASHAVNMAAFVSGLSVAAVSGELRTFVPGRETYDDGRFNLRLSGGAVGRMWVSFVAAGAEHGLRFRIFGETGSLHWDQERPELLVHLPAGGARRDITPGHDWLLPAGRHASRIRGGHPEGYLMAFANLYRDFAHILIARRLGEPVDPLWTDLPTIDDGVATMRFHEAAVASSDGDGRWVALADVDRPHGP